jgi:hypothetical protein
MSRAQRMCESLTGHVKAGGSRPDAEIAWDMINHFFKLYEILGWSMQASLDAGDFKWKDLAKDYPDLDMAANTERDTTLQDISTEMWGLVQSRLAFLLDPTSIALPATPDEAARSQFHKDLGKRISQPAQGTVKGNLLQDVDAQFEKALKNLPANAVGNLLRAEFTRFLDVDRQLFPILFGSGSESVDAIRVVRFSPRDAQRGFSQGDPSRKVCGGTLAAFGGFLKKNWHANVILMGRLDADCQLLQNQLTSVRLE